MPIVHVSLDQRINETKIADAGGRWRKKTARLLRQSYARRPFGADLAELISAFEADPEETLSELNISLITRVMRCIGIERPILKTSEMGLSQTDRTDRLIEIGKKLECDTYVSPVGAREYLESDGFVQRSHMSLHYMNQLPRLRPGCQRRVRSEPFDCRCRRQFGLKGAAAYVHGKWDG